MIKSRSVLAEQVKSLQGRVLYRYFNTTINSCICTLHLRQTDPGRWSFDPSHACSLWAQRAVPQHFPAPNHWGLCASSAHCLQTSCCLTVWEVPKEAGCVFLKSWVTFPLQFYRKWGRKEAGQCLTEQVSLLFCLAMSPSQLNRQQINFTF